MAQDLLTILNRSTIQVIMPAGDLGRIYNIMNFLQKAAIEEAKGTEGTQPQISLGPNFGSG